LETVWGPEIRRHPAFREVLIDASVAINAAQSAYNLHLEVERAGKWEIEVLYGVFNLANHRVSSPGRQHDAANNGTAGLAYAPTNPRVFKALALELAESYKARLFGSDDDRSRRGSPVTISNEA
jgi:hypothetical protein